MSSMDYSLLLAQVVQREAQALSQQQRAMRVSQQRMLQQLGYAGLSLNYRHVITTLAAALSSASAPADGPCRHADE